MSNHIEQILKAIPGLTRDSRWRHVRSGQLVSIITPTPADQDWPVTERAVFIKRERSGYQGQVPIRKFIELYRPESEAPRPTQITERERAQEIGRDDSTFQA